MTVISCDLRLVTDKAASVTELLVRAPRVRASGVKTVVTAPDRVPVTNGTASFTALPGPCVVTLVALDTPIATMDLLVPDVASATLVECILAGELVDTSTRSQLEQLAAEAAQAVTDARAEADRAAAALSGKADVVHTHSSDQVSDATAAATANTIIKRDASGRAQVADPSAAQDIANKQYADGLVDWDKTLLHKLWGKVPIVLDDGSISAQRVWIGSQGGYAASTVYVDSGGTQSEAWMSMWGAAWIFTKVGKTVFVTTNGTNIDTRQGWEFSTPIPDGYRPKYEQRLHFGDGTASCKIAPDGRLTALADYVAPVSFSYLAA